MVIELESIITVNGKPFPAPARGLEFIVSTFVSSGRNANGETVGQVVGRDNYKANNLVWPSLDAATWSSMLKEFANTRSDSKGFFVIATIPDMVNNNWLTIKMYPGDRSAKPYWVDKRTHLPISYTDCKCNLIDCGVIE